MNPIDLASQIASTAGAILILTGYFGLQTSKLKEDSGRYLLFNFVGGSLLFFASLVTGQIGFILLEGMWVAVTVLGWVKKLRRQAAKR